MDDEDNEALDDTNEEDESIVEDDPEEYDGGKVVDKFGLVKKK